MNVQANTKPELIYTIAFYFEDGDGCHDAGDNGMTYFSTALAEKLVHTKYKDRGAMVWPANEHTHYFVAAGNGLCGPELPFEDVDLPY